MNFDLSEDQILLQDSVNRYLQKALPLDKLIKVFDSEDGFDQQLWRQLFDLGIGAILAPEDDGGLGLELLDAAVVAEMLGYHAMPGPFVGQMLAIYALAEGGTPEQKAQWLPGLINGERIGTLAFFEPGDISEAVDWTLAATATLSGLKTHVVGGHLADVFVVGLQDGELALVDGNSSGINIELLNSTDRTRMASEVRFEDTPYQRLDGGVVLANKIRDALLVLLAADAFGGAARCNEMTLEYAKTREQFGTQIVNFQAVKHRLVDMHVDVELAKGLYWYAAHAFDCIPQESERMAALAKAHIAECYMQIARSAVEVHGGIGFTWEYPLQVFFKRAMFDRAYFGTPSRYLDRCADLAWNTSVKGIGAASQQ